MSQWVFLSLIFFQLCILLSSPENVAHAERGKWDLLVPSIGISSMHAQLLNNDKVVMFDRTDFGASNISLPGKNCRRDRKFGPGGDCSAHSVEYDVASNTVRPLMVLTNVWCSSGSMMADGSLIQTGGNDKGERVVRQFSPCNNGTCDWTEIKDALLVSRWYSTNHLLPDGKQIIIGGRAQFNYEFYPKAPGADQIYKLPFLEQTYDPKIYNNLYPFVFVNMDGNLFIFANNRAILFDYKNQVVVREYPEIPGGDPRSYPSTGSATLLPLKMLANDQPKAVEVLICGGAPKGSYTSAKKNYFVGALATCARMNINNRNPKWSMETMPFGRVMGDMVMLPNGDVLLINGASAGVAGWELARGPVFSPVIYKPRSPVGTRFEWQNPRMTPRMYHSTAVLLRDGRVLVGGSNPHNYYNFTGVLYPTELSLETFSPSYMEPGFANLRPKIISPLSQTRIKHGQKLKVKFRVAGKLNPKLVKVTMVAPPFNTHSFSMGQKLLVLNAGKIRGAGRSTCEKTVSIPRSKNIAQSRYYLLFVVHRDIPSEGIWVKL